jgi:hypothetical protein
VTRFNDLLDDDDLDWDNALSKGISFNDLDETQGNRTRNSLKDAFDDLQVGYVRQAMTNSFDIHKCQNTNRSDKEKRTNIDRLRMIN